MRDHFIVGDNHPDVLETACGLNVPPLPAPVDGAPRCGTCEVSPEANGRGVDWDVQSVNRDLRGGGTSSAACAWIDLPPEVRVPNAVA